MSKPSADTEAETVQQKSVYLRFVQRKKILYSARLIEFTVDSKYSSDHEPLSLEREIITRILFTTGITRIIIVIIHSLDCIDKSVQTYIYLPSIPINWHFIVAIHCQNKRRKSFWNRSLRQLAINPLRTSILSTPILLWIGQGYLATNETPN